MKLIFMGTPAFAVPTLSALIESAHEVVAIYTQPPRPAKRGQKPQLSPVHQLGEQHGIPVHTPETLCDDAEQQRIAEMNADAGIVVAYGLMLPNAVLDAPTHGCINIHPSLLPRWRGAAQVTTVSEESRRLIEKSLGDAVRRDSKLVRVCVGDSFAGRKRIRARHTDRRPCLCSHRRANCQQEHRTRFTGLAARPFP